MPRRRSERLEEIEAQAPNRQQETIARFGFAQDDPIFQDDRSSDIDEVPTAPGGDNPDHDAMEMPTRGPNKRKSATRAIDKTQREASPAPAEMRSAPSLSRQVTYEPKPKKAKTRHTNLTPAMSASSAPDSNAVTDLRTAKAVLTRPTTPYLELLNSLGPAPSPTITADNPSITGNVALAPTDAGPQGKSKEVEKRQKRKTPAQREAIAIASAANPLDSFTFPVLSNYDDIEEVEAQWQMLASLSQITMNGTKFKWEGRRTRFCKEVESRKNWTEELLATLKIRQANAIAHPPLANDVQAGPSTVATPQPAGLPQEVSDALLNFQSAAYGLPALGQEMFSSRVQRELSNAESVKNAMLQETNEAKKPRSKEEYYNEARAAEVEVALWKLGEAVMESKKT